MSFRQSFVKDTFDEDSSSWPHECPRGYIRYFGGVEHGCDINICVQKGTLKLESYGLLQPPRLPPFHVHHPHKLNDTESLTFTGSDGNIWTRNWLGEWSNTEPPASQCFADTTTTQEEIQTGTSMFTTQDQKTTTAQTTQKETTTSTGATDNEPLKANGSSTVAVTVPTILVAILVACVIVVVLVFIARHAYKHRHSGYNNIHVRHASNDHPSNLNTPA